MSKQELDKYQNVVDTVSKVVDSLVANRGYAYATGYLQTELINVMCKYIKEDSDLSMHQIRLLADGIDVKLGNKL